MESQFKMSAKQSSSSSVTGKRKIAPTAVTKQIPGTKIEFVADQLPKPALVLAPAPAPAPVPEVVAVPIPVHNSNPAEKIPVSVPPAYKKEYKQIDVMTLYPNRVELAVPFEEIAVVKKAGAMWWPEERIWFLPTGDGNQDIIANYAGEFLCLRKEDNPIAKQNGAIWRPQSQTWFGAMNGIGQTFGCVFLTRTTFQDGIKLKQEGARWSPLFRCWYTSRHLFNSNPSFSAFQ